MRSCAYGGMVVLELRIKEEAFYRSVPQDHTAMLKSTEAIEEL